MASGITADPLLRCGAVSPPRLARGWLAAVFLFAVCGERPQQAEPDEELREFSLSAGFTEDLRRQGRLGLSLVDDGLQVLEGHDEANGTSSNSGDAKVLLDGEGQTSWKQEELNVALERAPGGQTEMLRVVTWSTRQAMFNPFAMISLDGPKDYKKLMGGVDSVLSPAGPAADCNYCKQLRDTKVNSIFTEDMFKSFCKHISSHFGSDAVNYVAKPMWTSGFGNGGKGTPIGSRSLFDFVSDAELESSALLVEADLQTASVMSAWGKYLSRPSVITSSEFKFGDVATWWKQWQNFMFTEQWSFVALRDEDGWTDTMTKVMQTTLAVEPGGITGLDISTMIGRLRAPPNMSIISELQANFDAKSHDKHGDMVIITAMALCLAVYDTILVHLVTVLEPILRFSWNKVQDVMRKRVQGSDRNVLSTLEDVYRTANVIMLQEVTGTFSGYFVQGRLGTKFYLYGSKGSLHDSQPRALLALGVSYFQTQKSQDVAANISSAIREQLGTDLHKQIAVPGFLVAVLVPDSKDEPYLLVSYAGRPGGEKTLAVLGIIARWRNENAQGAHLMLGVTTGFGKHPKVADIDGKSFEAGLRNLKLTSVWGSRNSPTSYGHRSLLQSKFSEAQLFSEEKKLWASHEQHGYSDDHIIHDVDCWELRTLLKDNTGLSFYDAKQYYPTPYFHSDHALVFAKITMQTSCGQAQAVADEPLSTAKVVAIRAAVAGVFLGALLGFSFLLRI